MSDSNRPKTTTFARLAILLAGVWIGAGGLFKLLTGTPALLPPIVRETFADWDTVFRVAISVELAVAVLCIFRPRLGWFFAVLTLLVFDVVLTIEMQRGSLSCGCFGSWSPPPSMMLAIDTVLLLLVLASKPWKNVGRTDGAKIIQLISAALFFAGIVAPWTSLVPPPADPNAGVEQAGTSGAGTTSPIDATGQPATPQATTNDKARYAILKPEEWVGQSLADTDLGGFLRQGDGELDLITDGRVVLWRKDCEHCAKHLQEMAFAYDGSEIIHLVELPDAVGETIVTIFPENGPVYPWTLPAGLQYVLTTPWDLTLQGGLVMTAEQIKE